MNKSMTALYTVILLITGSSLNIHCMQHIIKKSIGKSNPIILHRTTTWDPLTGPYPHYEPSRKVNPVIINQIKKKRAKTTKNILQEIATINKRLKIIEEQHRYFTQ